MTDKEQYRELCKKELSIPIYSLDWWLDCVCENNKWDVLLFKNNDRIEAAMIYYSPAKKIITMPAYTQTMGIWFNPEFENRNYSDNLYRKQKICCFFIEHLPVHTFFLQYFHSSFTDWLPFYWNGYKQTTRYNYILPDINDTDKLFKCLGGDAKRNIAKAQKKFKLRIERKIPLDLFMEQYNMTFKQKGLKVYHPEILVKIITICIARNQGDIWAAIDEQNRIHTAVFIAWQNDCAYYIAAGNNPQFKKSGANAYTLWKAIVDIKEQVKTFDFSGSMLQGVEHFIKEFGAVQLPYFVISKGKMNLFQKILLKRKSLKEYVKKNIQKTYF